MTVSLSILDLVPVGSGFTPSQALKHTKELLQLADTLGYRRYWFAEHHNMASIASSAPEILIAHAAAVTSRIRIGAGGIMLPNHTPLRVAETFHTLEALHPGRIDLGIGRAPGTDPITSQVLRPFDAEHFPALMSEMISLSTGKFPEDHPFRTVRAMPDDVRLPPMWILSSSGASARFAGSLGLGYSFASHFSPTPPAPAIQAYRENFQSSLWFDEPHVILAVAVVCAETADEAQYHAKSMDLSWIRLRKGEHTRLPSPEEAANYPYTPEERAVVRERRSLLIVGDPPTVRQRIEDLVAETGADEVMISSMIHQPSARLKSYQLIARAFGMSPSGSSSSSSSNS